MSLTESQDATLLEFMGITGAEPEIAKEFLKACSWTVSTAVDRYFALDADPTKLSTANNQMTPSANAFRLFVLFECFCYLS